jgi:uncharacterized alpha-E superfamily protein
MSELLVNTLVHPIEKEASLLEPVLRTTDSLMTYRLRYLRQLQSAPAIDLLVTDDSNPRSIVFQLKRIDSIIGKLPTDHREVMLGLDEKLAKSLLNQVQMSDPFALTIADHHGKRNQLAALLERLIEELPRLSDAITARYLIHTGRTQSLTGRSDPWTTSREN